MQSHIKTVRFNPPLAVVVCTMLAIGLIRCSAPPEALIIPADVHTIFFMPPEVHQQLRWELQAFLRQNGHDSLWVDMEGKTDAAMAKRIQTVIAQSQVHDRTLPLTLIGFSKGNAGVLAAMGYWGQPPLAEKLTAIFLAPPPDAIVNRNNLYRLVAGQTMAFVYGTHDQPKQRRLLQRSQSSRQTISEITIAAGHSLRDYWQGAKTMILNLITTRP